MKINIRNNKYWVSLGLVWAVSALVLIGCYYVLHLPQKQVLTQIRQQFTESRDMALIADKAKRPDIREQMDQDFEQSRQTIAHFAVPQDNITGLVFEIGKIANELGLSDFASKNEKSPNISTLGKSPDVSEAWLEVEFQSSFGKLAQFINRLECQNPAVFVEEMTLRKLEEGRQDIEVGLELSFLVRQSEDNSVAIANAARN